MRSILDLITRHSGLNFIIDKDVRPDARVTIFVRDAKVEDVLDLLTATNQLSKKVLDSKTVLIYPNTPEKQRENQEQVIRVFYLANGDAKGAAAFLRSMLRIREPFVDERMNMVSIREAPETVQLAERLMAVYDAAEPEVLLDLEVIEVRSGRLTELGVQFPDSFSLTPIAPNGASQLTLRNLRDINSGDIAVGVSGLLVNLKRQVGDFNTLANPRIRVKNKEKAKVMVGDKVPVITPTISSGVGGFVSESVSYLDVGLKLDVEPSVYADDEVAIRVGLEVSAVAGQVLTKSGTLAYQIGTRNANTLLRLRDGETQLLAGLISKDDRTAANRIPGLGDLPVVGRLFGSTRDELNRTELVLAITPRILRNVRRLDASESEMWVGTEAYPRLRAPGGRSLTAVASTTPGQPRAAASGLTSAPMAVPVAQQAPVAPDLAVSWQAPAAVKVGETFAATLQLRTNSGLRGAPIALGFSKDTLALVDIEEGDFFRKDGGSTSFTKSVQAQDGVARAGSLRNQASAMAGQGSVVTVRFKAIAPGPAEVRLDNFEPLTLGDPPARPPLPAVHRLTVQ